MTWLCALLGLLVGATICGWARVASARWKLRLVAVLILGVVAMLAVEAGLRLTGEYPRRAVSRLLPDAGVGFTLDPTRADVDRHGFRNPDTTSAQMAQVIAVGDGLTEGVNVAAGESWPACLQRLLNVPVYNMGVSCFSPREYVRAVRQALDARPQHIVVCLNLADDFGTCVETATTAPPVTSLRQFLKRRTACGSYVHHTWRQLTSHSVANAGTVSDQAIPATRVPHLRQCLCNMDTTSEQVLARIQHTILALSAVGRECAARNVRLTVLLVPVQESVYEHSTHDAAADATFTADATGTVDSLVGAICQQQQDLVNRLTQSMAESGVTVVNVLPMLQSSLEAGQQPFAQEEHGYPSIAGYAVCASAVAQALQSAAVTN